MGQKGSEKNVVQSVAATKPYNAYLDVLKGFAIALVVLGHSIQTYDSNFDNNLLFRIIYSFHMPLFMFLSGAAAAYSLRRMDLAFLKRKFFMLVIPFVSWYVIGYFLTGAHQTEAFTAYIHKVIVSPDNGLWFLWVLFLNFCCLALINRLAGRFKLYSYPIVWLAVMAIPTSYYGVGLVKWHLPFFLAGYLVFKYRESLIRYRKAVLYLSAATFPLLVASWHRLYLPVPVTDLSRPLEAHGLAFVQVGYMATINVFQILTLLYTYLVPFAGIGFVYWLFKLKPSRQLYGLFGFLGIYTLDIYVSEFYFFKFSIGASRQAIMTSFVTVLVLTVLLGMILRRVPALSTVFLGGRAKIVTPKLGWLKKLQVRAVQYSISIRASS